MDKADAPRAALPAAPPPGSPLPPLPRSLCVAMLVQFAAGGALIPFVTLWLRDRGLDFPQISVIFASASGMLTVFPFLWGMLADRFLPLNRLFTLLNLVAGAALLVFARQTEFSGLLIAYLVFFACFNPTLTLINALSFHHLASPREQFGRLRAWGSVGWILPFLPIALGTLDGARAKLDFAVYLSASLCFGMAAISFGLPHTPPGARRGRDAPATRRVYWPALKRLLADPNYGVILASMFLVSGSYTVLIYYSPPYLEDLGVPRPWQGPVQAIGVVFEIILFQGLAGMIRRWNYATVILLGCVALLGRHLMFAWLESPWLLSASYLLAGAVIVFFHMGVSVLVNGMAATEVRATAQTLLAFFGQALGPLFANWTAGRLSAQTGNDLRAVFLFAAGLAAVAATLVAARGRQLNVAAHGGAGPNGGR